MAKKLTVTECRHTNVSKGGRTKLWAFSVADLAALAGKSEGAVRRDIRDGALDPTNLVGVFAWAYPPAVLDGAYVLEPVLGGPRLHITEAR